MHACAFAQAGNPKNAAANDPNPFRYCGEYHDEETGEIYLRARYYNPATGRFGSEDPARSGLNWYGYCGNNPVQNVDPSGLRPLTGNDKVDSWGSPNYKELYKNILKEEKPKPPSTQTSEERDPRQERFDCQAAEKTAEIEREIKILDQFKTLQDYFQYKNLWSSLDPFAGFVYNAGSVDQDWGWRTLNGQRDFHNGHDFGTTNVYAPLYSVWFGTVVYSNEISKRGSTIIILLNDELYGEGKYVLLQHLDNRGVAVGTSVLPGDYLANAGKSGGFYPVHLHLEVLLDHNPNGPVESSVSYQDLNNLPELPNFWSVDPFGSYSIDAQGNPLIIRYH